jgi:hypothetical protein
MPIEPIPGIAVFLPLLFAFLSAALAWRHLRNPYLFLLTAVLIFSYIQDVSYVLIHSSRTQEQAEIRQVIAIETQDRFLADVISAVVGGLIVWRLGSAFQKR